MLKPEQNCPGYPRGRLSVVKHRQLARQVGAFGEFASESSTDLVNMIFSTGSAFIFGLWICKADDNDKLQGRLLKDLDHHEDLTISATTADQITGKLARLVMSDPTQISRPTVFHAGPSSFPLGLHNATIQSSLENSPSSFPAGLQNAASTYQEFNSENIQSSLRVLFWRGSRTRHQPIKNSTRKAFRVLSRIVRVLF